MSIAIGARRTHAPRGKEMTSRWGGVNVRSTVGKGESKYSVACTWVKSINFSRYTRVVYVQTYLVAVFFSGSNVT